MQLEGYDVFWRRRPKNCSIYNFLIFFSTLNCCCFVEKRRRSEICQVASGESVKTELKSQAWNSNFLWALNGNWKFVFMCNNSGCDVAFYTKKTLMLKKCSVDISFSPLFLMKQVNLAITAITNITLHCLYYTMALIVVVV